MGHLAANADGSAGWEIRNHFLEFTKMVDGGRVPLVEQDQVNQDLKGPPRRCECVDAPPRFDMC